jgi:hypothetical protein
MNIIPRGLTSIALFIGCVFSLLTPSVIAVDIESYSFVRSITPIPAEEELAAITLDNIIWSHSPSTPPDIRIAGEEGHVIPHLLQKATEQRMRSVREQCGSTLGVVKELPGNQLEVSVSLNEKAPLATIIEFVTPLKDFERQITVQGKDASGVTTTLVENALIYDYSRFADVRHCSVTMPPNNCRTFSIIIGNVTDEAQSPQRQISRTEEQGEEVRMIENTTVRTRPFRMDSVKLYRVNETESHRIDLKQQMPVKSWSVERPTGKKQTVVGIETANQPLTGFILETSNRNYTRRMRVEIPDGKSWRPVGRSSISRISFRRLLREENRITFSERRSTRFRLVIEDMDNPPLDITGIKAIGPVWQALYIASPGLQAKCYYNSGNPAPPRYDTTAIMRILDGGFAPVEFTFGEPVENSGYRRSNGSWKDLISSKAFFIGAVAIMIAVMAGALVKAVRRLN